MKNYVVGYGSLMNSESRRITGLTGNAWPIWLNNYQRCWAALFSELNFCALAVTPQKGAKLAAVLFEVLDLVAFDEREMGYTRVAISINLIQSYMNNSIIPETGNFWIYIPQIEKLGEPNSQHLIWQSYVDVCLTGCFEYSDSFAQDFVRNTLYWKPQYWANDREKSHYVRALKNFDAAKIDSFLTQENLKAERLNFDDTALQSHVKKRLT